MTGARQQYHDLKDLLPSEGCIEIEVDGLPRKPNGDLYADLGTEDHLARVVLCSAVLVVCCDESSPAIIARLHQIREAPDPGSKSMPFRGLTREPPQRREGSRAWLRLVPLPVMRRGAFTGLQLTVPSQKAKPISVAPIDKQDRLQERSVITDLVITRLLCDGVAHHIRSTRANEGE